MAFLVLLC